MQQAASHSLDLDSRTDGSEADVGIYDLGIGDRGLDVGGSAGVRSAVSTVATGGTGLLGRVAGVEPEHVGIVLEGQVSNDLLPMF